jgi:hypothetical protein
MLLFGCFMVPLPAAVSPRETVLLRVRVVPA